MSTVRVSLASALTHSSLVSFRRSAALRQASTKTCQRISTSAMASSSDTEKKQSISSYLPTDTYNSLQPGDGDLTFLHTMLRVNDLQKTIDFFKALGLMETRRKESEKGKFTLVFMASAPGVEHGTHREEEKWSAVDEVRYTLSRGAPEVELTYNWGGEDFAPPSRSMGHLAYATDDIYVLCASLQAKGIVINRPPRDGKMAFVRSPDGISVELLQKGQPLAVAEPWASMENVGEW